MPLYLINDPTWSTHCKRFIEWYKTKRVLCIINMIYRILLLQSLYPYADITLMWSDISYFTEQITVTSTVTKIDMENFKKAQPFIYQM